MVRSHLHAAESDETGYRLHQFSYFEHEGDKTMELPYAIPEDELWVRIRIDPKGLPLGEFDMIPGTMNQRLRHSQWKLLKVRGKLEAVDDQKGLMAYTITYPEVDRSLTIHFNAAFPHEIEGWEETYRSGRGPHAVSLTTRAKRTHRILSDYWDKNSASDVVLRDQLGLRR